MEKGNTMKLIDADALYIPPEEMNAKIAVACAPTIDAVPVAHGEWINTIGSQYKCSECGSPWAFCGIPKPNYCPNCGAKMDGERKEEGED